MDKNGKIIAPETTKIVDLDHDCVYDTLIHLEIFDLETLVNASSHFAPAARQLFVKK